MCVCTGASVGVPNSRHARFKEEERVGDSLRKQLQGGKQLAGWAGVE